MMLRFLKNSSYKMFFILGGLGFLAVFVMLLIHIYVAPIFFDSTRFLSSPYSAFLVPEKKEFTIAIASDSGSENRVLEAVIKDAKRHNPDFMLYLGDFMDHRTDTGLYWMFLEIGPHIGDMPFYPVFGNHDITEHKKRDLYPMKKILGNVYYWFGYGDVLFIALDIHDESIDDAQLEWLRGILNNIRPLFKHCVIYSHVPPINIRQEFDHKLDDTSVEKLKNVLKDKKITAMLFGHVHYFDKGEFIGIPVYTIPSSGQLSRDNKPNTDYGYAIMEFDKHGIKKIYPKYIDFNGSTREYQEFWLARDICSFKVVESINPVLLFSLLCFIVGGICYSKQKQHKV